MEQVLILRDGQYVPETPAAAEKLGHGQGAGAVGRMEVFGLEIGDAVFGGVTALVVDGLLSGIIPAIGGGNVGTAASKFVSAWAVNQFAKGFIGPQAAKFGATLLAFDGIQDLIPIREWVGNLVGGMSGFIPKSGGPLDPMAPNPPGNMGAYDPFEAELDRIASGSRG